MRITHAGGVVYKKGESADTQYLLITSGTGDWVLPKGHIEPGENPERAALREIKEEAGITGKIIRYLGDTAPYDTTAENNIVVSYFLVESVGEETSLEDREHLWCSLEDAMALVQHDELKRILSMAG